MRNALFAAAVAAVLSAGQPVLAQDQAPAAATTAVQAKPADVESIEAILAAVYDVISGDAGQARDWDRFRSLFHPSARLIPTGIRPSGEAVASFASPEDYITRSGPALMQGFHEKSIADRVERFGHIAHVWSTYEARRKADDAQPMLRGINTFQLWNDGQRWWVMNILWQAESDAYPIPAEYLPPQ